MILIKKLTLITSILLLSITLASCGGSGGAGGGDDPAVNTTDNPGTDNPGTGNPVTKISSNADLSAINLSEGSLSPGFSADVTEYTVTVSHSTEQINIEAATSDDKAVYSITPQMPSSLVVGDNDFTIAVTAEDGTEKHYSVNVVRAASSAKSIVEFRFEGLSASGTVDEANESISVEVPYGTVLDSLVPTISYSGVLISPASGIAQNFNSDVLYTVTAEDGTTRDYEVTVSVAANTAKEITSFSFTAAANTALNADVTGTFEENNIIRVNVPAGTALTSLTADFSLSAEAHLSLGGAIQESGNTSNDFSDDVVYTVTAEDGSTQEYTVWVLTTVPDRSTLDAMIANEEDVSRLDTSLITDMSYLFEDRTAFNQDISRWDVSSVTDMGYMFYNCDAFNQDIGQWDVSSVTDMSYMFENCYAFNQDIGEWDVSSVTNMRDMFNNCLVFNQDIGEWDVSSVANMRRMFLSCYAFNQDIGEWDVSSVTDMKGMFYRCRAFNQDIGEWDVSTVTNMSYMFETCDAFNQDIGEWDVSNVITMSAMFLFCDAFNQDIGKWDVCSVEDMSFMFYRCRSFNQDIGEWDVSSVIYMNGMFNNCDAFNQDIGEWDVSNVINMRLMFFDCDAFNHDLSSWADHVAETIIHYRFSDSAPLFETANHPYASWDIYNPI